MDTVESLVEHAEELSKNKNKMPSFYEYVRRLECIHKNLSKVGTAIDVNSEIVSFAQVPHLHFPASDMESVTILSKKEQEDNQEDSWRDSWKNKQQDHQRVLINQYFFGLLGAHGPMPLEYTSYIMNRSNNSSDRALQKFLDIVNHRMLALYYRAWAHNEQAVDYDRKGGLISHIVGAISGSVSNIYHDDKDVMSENFERSFARFLSLPIRSKDGLEKMLNAYFHENVKVITNVETRHSIPKNYYCRLGRKDTCVLGYNAQIGTHYMSNSKKIVIEFILPDFKRCQRLLPGTYNFEKLVHILNSFLNKPTTFDVKYIIKQDTLLKSNLSGKNALGMDIMLKDHADKPYDITIIVTGYNRNYNKNKN